MFNYFRGISETVEYKAGDVIFHAGDPDDKMYAVIEGEVDLAFNGEMFETVEKGGILGEKSLLDDSAHTTTATAKSDCKIALVDEEKFLWLVHETPMFALHVMRVMAQRTRSIMMISMK